MCHCDLLNLLPSGKRLQFANWKIAIEIVDLPMKKMVIFHSYLLLYQRLRRCKESDVQFRHLRFALRASLPPSVQRCHDGMGGDASPLAGTTPGESSFHFVPKKTKTS